MTEAAKKVILLVDDTPANIQIALSILKDLYQVRVATNGTKALELAAADPIPDLILLDVMMPGIDGFEVCTRLKASPSTHDIPVIFLTGQTEIEDETRGFEVGGVDYIHKPFSPAVVKARVHTHLVLRGIREKLAQQLAAMKGELETARQIQLSILPREMPSVSGLDVAARYIRLHPDRRQASRRFCGGRLRPWNAGGADLVDAEDRARGADARSLGAGAGDGGTQPGPVRQVQGALCHCGVCLYRYGEEDPSLCRGRPSAAGARRRNSGFSRSVRGEWLDAWRLLLCYLHFRRKAVPRGNAGAALHRWNS
jgi:CheY-like chemotaxis protein